MQYGVNLKKKIYLPSLNQYDPCSDGQFCCLHLQVESPLYCVVSNFIGIFRPCLLYIIHK